VRSDNNCQKRALAIQPESVYPKYFVYTTILRGISELV
jgi:hypothetical protein